MTINNQKTRRMTRNLTALVLGTVLLAGSVQAEERWSFRFGGVAVDGDQALALEGASGSQVIAGGDSALGASMALEYRFTDRLGIELGTAFADVPDWQGDHTEDDGTTIGEGPSFSLVTASLT